MCVRAQRVQNTDEMVVTKAKKMGKELFAELQPDARKKMLDSVVCCYLLNKKYVPSNEVSVPLPRQTDRQKDASDFVICPMLCYSSGTDNDGR